MAVLNRGEASSRVITHSTASARTGHQKGRGWKCGGSGGIAKLGQVAAGELE
jgi:hypothetical protein